MTARYFVDTNVLVYARDSSEPDKQRLASQWLRALWQNRNGCLSFQVLKEYYLVVTQRLSQGMTAEEARADIRDLLAWEPVVMDTAVLENAWLAQDRFRFSWWDALIVAAAQRAGCRYLLTEDLQNGQNLDGVTVLNPFEVRPESMA
ncbi:MAG TPA: PIN domain-containing protein [Nitrococcus sp.]|nr:PIN domain-containing protein [Nitrococcus sp.]